MSDLEGVFKKPSSRFSAATASQWVPLAYQMGLRNVPLKVLAYKLNCHINTVRDNLEVLEAYHEGIADHRLTVEDLLWTDATASPDFAVDAVEKAAIRVAKSAALKLLKSTLDRNEAFVAPQETERIRRLSDKELQEELKKHVKHVKFS